MKKSQYELDRDARVARNLAIMALLKISPQDIRAACACANVKNVLPLMGDEAGGDSVVTAGPTASKKVQNKRKRAPVDDVENDAAPTIEIRKSRRLQELAAELRGLDDDDGHVKSKPSSSGAEELSLEHEAAKEAHERRHAGSQKRAMVYGTASYKHTLMRVKTMSENALKNRVKAIERSKGKHAVVKMRLFAQVLFLEGYEELSEEAAAALARLVELLGEEQQE
uniref:Uncharacterized protein n=1 Tax=Pycnococcus provasolii TaxID=41880 RepID=A0A6U0DH25_9CHLO|mmetsp:Transcript_7613/g.17258  ORF Transcript_7613/g.17258 Transcript_7613/m.17258 type:complete len:225 (+) Transcript_7613:94-768(+)